MYCLADIDTGSNTSYSDVSTGSNTSYSDVATGSNTSYNDVTGEKYGIDIYTLGVELRQLVKMQERGVQKQILIYRSLNKYLVDTHTIVSNSGDTTLSVSDGSTGATLSHRVIEFTGSLTASRIVTIPLRCTKLLYLKKFNFRFSKRCI